MGRKRTNAEVYTDHYQWVEDHIAAASLAYQENNTSELEDSVKLSEDWSIYKVVDTPLGIRAKIWINPKTGDILVGFRGTSSLAEAKVDATLGASPFKDGTGSITGSVYKGFGDAWEQISVQINKEIETLRENNYKSSIQFTGHSLGGALAELASVYYSGKYPDTLIFETSVGAPTSGDKTFGDYARSRQNLHMTRIIAPGDPVANVKLPGMDHPEKVNVINVGTVKKSQLSVEDMFSKINPIVDSLYTGYKRHSLETYASALNQNWSDHKRTSLEDSDTSFHDSKLSGIPTEECRCECHAYDAAIAQGKEPPPSHGSMVLPGQPEQSASPPQQTTAVTALEQKVPSPPVEYDVSDTIRAALEDQEQRDTQNKTKLEARYAELMGKDDLDPVQRQRQQYTKAMDDMTYYDKRLEMELQHPSMVPGDDRDVAVGFKNKMNRLYAVILQSKSKAQLIPPTEKVDFEEDQIQQEESAKKNHILSPDEQPNEWVFDTTLLSDLEETESPLSEKQLQEWLGYPTMNPKKLYDMLKTEFTSKYKDERLMTLRQNDEKLKEETVTQIKQQLESDDLVTHRKEVFENLSTNSRFKELVKAGKVDVGRMIRDYKPDTFQISEVLGYDPKTFQEVLREDYHKQADAMTRETDPSTWQRAYTELDQIYEENLKYPWVSGQRFRELKSEFKNDPQGFDKAMLQLSPSVPENYQTQKLESYVPQKTDDPNVDLPNYKDYYEIQDKAFQDVDNVKRLFKQWNGGKVDKGLKKDVLGLLTGGISGIDHLLEDKNNRGWYMGDTFLGLKADKSIVEYLKRHPESNIEYRTPSYSKTLESASHGVNTLLETFTGISPEDMLNYTSDAFNLNVPEGKYLQDVPKEKPENTSNVTRTVGGALTAVAIYQRVNEKGVEGMINAEKTEKVVETANKFKTVLSNIAGRIHK